MMKQFLRKTMKNIATYVELVLSAFLVFVIAILIIKLVGQYFLIYGMTSLSWSITWNMPCRLL